MFKDWKFIRNNNNSNAFVASIVLKAIELGKKDHPECGVNYHGDVKFSYGDKLFREIEHILFHAFHAATASEMSEVVDEKKQNELAEIIHKTIKENLLSEKQPMIPHYSTKLLRETFSQTEVDHYTPNYEKATKDTRISFRQALRENLNEYADRRCDPVTKHTEEPALSSHRNGGFMQNHEYIIKTALQETEEVLYRDGLLPPNATFGIGKRLEFKLYNILGRVIPYQRYETTPKNNEISMELHKEIPKVIHKILLEHIKENPTSFVKTSEREDVGPMFRAARVIGTPVHPVFWMTEANDLYIKAGKIGEHKHVLQYGGASKSTKEELVNTLRSDIERLEARVRESVAKKLKEAPSGKPKTQIKSDPRNADKGLITTARQQQLN